jgi:hypothetical protein
VDLVRIGLREAVTADQNYWPVVQKIDDNGSGGGESKGGSGGGKGGSSWGRNLKTHLVVMTNVTTVKIPLLVFDGKLKPVRHSTNAYHTYLLYLLVLCM